MSSIGGNTQGLKKSDLAQLDKLYRRTLGRDELFQADLAEELCEVALSIKRPVGVLMNPKGHVHWVYVGDLDILPNSATGWRILPDENAPPRLSDYTCFHAMVGKPLTEAEQVPLNAQVTALQFHFAAMGMLVSSTSGDYSRQYGEHPKFCDGVFLYAPTWLYAEQKPTAAFQKRLTAHQLSQESHSQWREWGENVMTEWEKAVQRRPKGERAFLISVDSLGTQHKASADAAMAELYELAKTAGATVLGELRQKRSQPDSKSFLGQGKAEELALYIQQEGATVVIANDTLSPVQQRKLEALTRVKVIDRTELILDIFAQRARSREGQIQVELAQYKYLLPRLVGRGRMFSQQTAVGAKGSIATRGPGETQLETDRRLIHQRIDRLEKEAEAVVAQRHLQRNQRRTLGKTTVALVGYTNAGKSTLLKRLTGADVLVEDQLFATLDPTTRRLYLPSGEEILMSDTVGFIQKLPTFLIQAFRGTLEEVKEAQLVLHVWDVSHPDRESQFETVLETLEALEAIELPRMTLLNKIDLLPPEEAEDWQESGWFKAAAAKTNSLEVGIEMNPLAISATTGEGLDTLVNQIAEKLTAMATAADEAAIQALAEEAGWV